VAAPILMYHSVAHEPPGAARALSVSPPMFAAQLERLCELGFTAVTFSQMAAGLRGRRTLPGRAIALTFDDGYADFHTEALPVLNRLGIPATLFVTTGWLRDAGPHAAGHPLGEMLAWTQVIEAAACGVEIGAHGHSHAQLDQLPAAGLRREVTTCRALLEDRLGRAITTFACPYGYSNAKVRRELWAAGYTAACVVGNRMADPSEGPDVVPRLTIRRSTSLKRFERIISGQWLALTFLGDRTLTKSWALVRRSRFTVNGVLGRV